MTKWFKKVIGDWELADIDLPPEHLRHEIVKIIDGKKYKLVPVKCKEGVCFAWLSEDGELYNDYSFHKMGKIGEKLEILEPEIVLSWLHDIERANKEFEEFLTTIHTEYDDAITFIDDVPVLDDTELECYIEFVRKNGPLIKKKIKEIEEKYRVKFIE